MLQIRRLEKYLNKNLQINDIDLVTIVISTGFVILLVVVARAKIKDKA